MSTPAAGADAAADTDSPAAAAKAVAVPRVPKSSSTAAATAAAAANGDDDAVDLSSLLAPTARSRPVLLQLPISLSTPQSRRSRLTAVDSNARAVLIAASTGTLYAYQKPNPALLLQAAAAATTAVAAAAAAANRVGLLKLVSRTKDAITHVKFCPTHDDIVAIATAANQIMVLDLRLTQLKEKEVLLFNMPGLPPLHAATAGSAAAAAQPASSPSSDDSSVGHRDRISSLTWDPFGMRLFSGDRSGVVMCSRPFGSAASPAAYLSSSAASSSSSFFAKKPQLREQAHIILRADSEIVQMVCVEGEDAHARSTGAVAAAPAAGLFLAVSSLTKCVVVPVSKPGPVVSVGTKVRNGPFGVCKNPAPDGAAPSRASETTLLASRPGKRVWCADLQSGQVLSTLKLKLPPPTSMQPFALPSTMALATSAAAVQFYHLQSFQHSLLSYYPGDSCTAGGLLGPSPATLPPASPYLLFIDPHHVVVHELLDMGGPVRAVATPTRPDGAASAEIWVLHEGAKDSAAAAAAAAAGASATSPSSSASPPIEGDSDGALQLSVLFAYPADFFLAHTMKLTPSLFPALTSLSPALLAPHPSLPALPGGLAGLFPGPVAAASPPGSWQPQLDFFLRLAVRHHVHDRGLLTLLRNKLTEAMRTPATVVAAAEAAAEGGSTSASSSPAAAGGAAVLPGGVDEQLLAAFEALINEAEQVECLRVDAEAEAATAAAAAANNAAETVVTISAPQSQPSPPPSGLPPATAPMSIPLPSSSPSKKRAALAPSPSPSIPSSPTFGASSSAAGPLSQPSPGTSLSLQPSSSIESLFTKAAHSLSNSFRSAAPIASAASASGAPSELSATAAAVAAATAPPRSETPDPGQWVPPSGRASASVSLSSSPAQFSPGAFLPPPPSQSSSASALPISRLPRSTSSVNPFISSLPPPQLPGVSKAASASVSSTVVSSASSASSSSASSGSGSSSMNFFKEFIKDVSNEWNGIGGGSSSSAASTSSAAAAASSSSAAAAAAAAAASSSASSAHTAAAASSSTAAPSAGASEPLAFKTSILPASGPFGAPVLSPMLAKSASVTRTPPASSRTLHAGGRAQALGASPLALAFSGMEVDDQPELSAQFLAVPPLALEGGAAGSGAGKRRRKKGPAEVVQIARAPAKLLPTPFQPDPSAEAAAAKHDDAEGATAAADAEQQEAEEEAALQAAAASVTLLSLPARKLKKKKSKLKPKEKEQSAAGAVAEPAPEASPAQADALGFAASSSSASAPAAMLSLPECMDDGGIDPADLAGDDDEEGGEGGELAAAAVKGGGDALGEEADVEGRGEGEAQPHLLAADQEGEGVPESAEVIASFAHVRAAAQSALLELDDCGVLESWRAQAQWSALAPALQQLEVAHGAVDAVRRERFGTLGCEPPSMTDAAPHRPLPAALFPSFSWLLPASLAELEQTASAKPRSRRASLSHLARSEPLDAFLAAWLCALEQTLLGEAHVPIGVVRPAAAPQSSIAALAARAQLLAGGLVELQQQDPRAKLLVHVQQLLLVILQLQLRERVTAAAAVPVAGEDGVAAAVVAQVPSVWSTEDVLAFVRTWAPLLSSKQVCSLCSAYELGEVVEQLHAICSAADPAPDAKALGAPSSAVVEQLLSSNLAEHAAQAFQILKRQHDPLLSHRFLRGCFHRGGGGGVGGGSSNLGHQLPLSLALDHAVHMYPGVGAWVVAKHLDIKVSWFCATSLAERVRDGTRTTMDRLAADLSAAPESLVFHPSYLDMPSDHSRIAQQLQAQSAPQPLLDRPHQAYHCYLHYLRALLSAHEAARRSSIIVLEYIRVCMCFSRPKHDQLFRRQSQQDAMAAAVEQKWLPARDSQLPGLWVHEAAMLAVLTQPTVYALDAQALGRLFAKHGFFKGVMTLHTQQLQASTCALDAEERAAVTRQCLLMALCSDDVSSLVSCIDNMVVTATTPLEQRVQLWKFLLKQLHALSVSPDAATIAPRNITLRLLLNHMLYSIGSQLSVTLLLSSPTLIELCDRANLPASFYSDIIDAAVLRCEQLTLNHALLESVDSYLWSDRTRNVSQNLRAVYNTEVSVAILQQQTPQAQQQQQQSAGPKSAANSRRGSGSGGVSSSSATTSASGDRDRERERRSLSSHPLSPFIAFRGDGASGGGSDDKPSRRRGSASTLPMQRLNDYSLTFDYGANGAHDADLGAALPVYYEDMSNQGHWGTSVDLQSACCAECALPLAAPSADTCSPLVAFRCAHVYHASCMQQRACTLCWDQHAALPSSS